MCITAINIICTYLIIHNIDLTMIISTGLMQYMRGRTGYNKISHTGSVMQKYGGNVNHIHNTHTTDVASGNASFKYKRNQNRVKHDMNTT